MSYSKAPDSLIREAAIGAIAQGVPFPQAAGQVAAPQQPLLERVAILEKVLQELIDRLEDMRSQLSHRLAVIERALGL